MNRKTIVVLFGGVSSEYEVSLSSAYAVLTNMDIDKYHCIPVGITKEGKWLLFEGEYQKIKENTWIDDTHKEVVLSLNRKYQELIVIEKEMVIRQKIDAVFPILHGKNGEDGSLQGLVKVANIPLIGCDVISSALCMDKNRAHQLVGLHGIHVPKAVVLQQVSEYEVEKKRIQTLEFPLFIKPMKAGSSYGISKVYMENEILPAIEKAFLYDNEVIIEENIEGFEVGCAIMGTNQLKVGEVDEIEITDGFFDYTEKYTLKSSQIHLPARIPKALKKRVQQTAKTIYKILGCKVFARVDMFITPDQTIVFNEVNTIPGFTAHSRYPNMMKAMGFTFPEIIDAIIEEGLTYADHTTQ